MKNTILILLAFIFISNTCFASDTYRVKDKYGRYQGKYVRVDNITTKRYDSYNRYSGKIVNKNNKLRVYDKYGRFEYEAE